MTTSEMKRKPDSVKKCCAIGAIDLAAHKIGASVFEENLAMTRLAQVIRKRYATDVIYYNDHMARRADDIISRMREAQESPE